MSSLIVPVAPKLATKRLVVCCDGTWMNSNEGTARQGGFASTMLNLGGVVLQQPTNVTRICRSVKPTIQVQTGRESQEIKQITYYGSGVGTANVQDHLEGGLTGEGESGVAEHIREAYEFIATNYSAESNDEIILIGFSRGSFTARSVASFINDVGLLTPLGLTYFYPIFEDWENQQKMLKPSYKPSFPDYPFPGPRPHMYPDPKAYTEKLVQLGYTRPNIRIKAVTVFDTVGSLGVPRIDFWHNVSSPKNSIDFAFVDTTVPQCVDNAIHALALDEIRRPFAPTMWEKPAKGQNLTQVWFVGGHADVGGSHKDTASANITLAWMINQLSPFVEFDEKMLLFQYDNPPPTVKRDWSCGVLSDDYPGFYSIFDYTVRTPGDYTRYNHDTGEPYVPAQPLQDTHEKIHSSVRIRCGIPGHIPASGSTPDAGVYTCPAFASKSGGLSWKLKGLPTTPVHTGQMSLDEIHALQKNIQWIKPGNPVVMVEDLISAREWNLLKKVSPDIADNFFKYGPK